VNDKRINSLILSFLCRYYHYRSSADESNTEESLNLLNICIKYEFRNNFTVDRDNETKDIAQFSASK
jgi:hypothetical protein